MERRTRFPGLPRRHYGPKEDDGAAHPTAKKLAVAQLSAGIAHEFNNILGVIKLSAEMLIRNRDLDREFKEGLARICRGSGRAGSLVKQLLIFTRTQKLSLCPIDVHETICNLQDLIEKILGPNSRLHLSTTSQAVTVQADRSALEQVILNIALNARDAMPQGGDLFIEDGSKERTPPHPNSKDPFLPRDHAFISIRDTGHGMTEEIRKRIFEPFFTTRQPDKGTGLGLSTVYGIVEEHKGWIEVESQVDHGSTFEIFLPLSAKARPQKEPSQDDEMPFSEFYSSDAKILLVEDEKDFRLLLKTLLEGEGFCVIEAASGEAALAIWERSKDEIALLYTDIVMPGISGLEVARKVRRDRPECKVIISSGFNKEQVGNHLDNEEGFLFLPKSPNSSKIIELVRDCLKDQATPEPAGR